MLRGLSLGAGVQSTTLALMIAHREIKPVDFAIFSDTTHEPRAVYEHLRWLMSPNVLPFPVHVVSNGDLWASASRLRTTKDGARSYLKTGIPVFTLDGTARGRGNRQCTADFKIDPIQAKLRKLLGRRRIMADSGVLVEMLIGISTDEAMRMKPSREHWIRNAWPLIDRNLDRQSCLEWLKAHDYPEPPRSACTFCPHHDDGFWLDMPRDEFADVCAKEKELQAAYEASGHLTSKPFFHRSCVPLAEVKFIRPTVAPRQRPLDFGAECEGMCGV